MEMEMEMKQQLEWTEAQKIVISKDLVAAAKTQVRFLAQVDRNRHLYAGPALDCAIYRYKKFWLPLLAKFVDQDDDDDDEMEKIPLAVPLDCEWIWHCHRLNPLRYAADCRKEYGRILDNRNTVSSFLASSNSTERTKDIWRTTYPNEPFELDQHLSDEINHGQIMEALPGTTNYDLISAVSRQSTFYYHVSKPCMEDNHYLQASVERYKAYLHLIKTDLTFLVPTYDIDLIWHSHQLHPVSYHDDTMAVIGNLLGHDDNVSDRSKGTKLVTGFAKTTRTWERMFGKRYWRAGAMHRGNCPSQLPQKFAEETIVFPSIKFDSTILQLQQKQKMEVMLEIVDIKNLPVGKEDDFCVCISKKQTDMFFNSRRRQLSFQSGGGMKNVAAFTCEPNGELIIDIFAKTESLGAASISLDEQEELFMETWLELKSSTSNSSHVSIRVAVSLTPPVQAPFVFHVEETKDSMGVVDGMGNKIINIPMRDKEEGWSLMGSKLLLQPVINGYGDKEIKFLLIGDKKVGCFHGRRLKYEVNNIGKEKDDDVNCITMIEFSEEHPYGEAMALIDFNSGGLKVEQEWLVLPAISLTLWVLEICRGSSGCCLGMVNERGASIARSCGVEARGYGMGDRVAIGDSCGGGALAMNHAALINNRYGGSGAFGKCNGGGGDCGAQCTVIIGKKGGGGGDCGSQCTVIIGKKGGGGGDCGSQCTVIIGKEGGGGDCGSQCTVIIGKKGGAEVVDQNASPLLEVVNRIAPSPLFERKGIQLW